MRRTTDDAEKAPSSSIVDADLNDDREDGVRDEMLPQNAVSFILILLSLR
jgi:hypothetical protein